MKMTLCVCLCRLQFHCKWKIAVNKSFRLVSHKIVATDFVCETNKLSLNAATTTTLESLCLYGCILYMLFHANVRRHTGNQLILSQHFVQFAKREISNAGDFHFDRERASERAWVNLQYTECVCILSFPVRPCIFPCLSFATQTNFRSSCMKIIKFNASPMHAYAAYLRNAVNFVLCESIKEQNETFPLISLFSWDLKFPANATPC